jgi:hypothetical protein
MAGMVPSSYIHIVEEASNKKFVLAQYNYDAQTKEELSIKEGEVIEVVGKHDEGWMEGTRSWFFYCAEFLNLTHVFWIPVRTLEGNFGQIPANYVTEFVFPPLTT